MASVTRLRIISESGDGEVITILRIVPDIEARHMGDANAKIAGLPELRTEDGGPVNFLGDERYKVVLTGRTYRLHP
jgi:hypothetical protein